MKNKEPTEKEFEKVVKNILNNKSDKPLKPCNEYPTSRELKQKFKLERKPC